MFLRVVEIAVINVGLAVFIRVQNIAIAVMPADILPAIGLTRIEGLAGRIIGAAEGHNKQRLAFFQLGFGHIVKRAGGVDGMKDGPAERK